MAKKKPSKHTGRKRLLDKQSPKIDEVIKRIELGCTRDASVKAAGLSKAVFYRWLKLGYEKKEKIYIDFLERVERAEADSQVRSMITIRKAAEQDNDWRAAAWFLERRFKKDFGKLTTVEVKLPKSPKDMSDDELEKWEKVLEGQISIEELEEGNEERDDHEL